MMSEERICKFIEVKALVTKEETVGTFSEEEENRFIDDLIDFIEERGYSMWSSIGRVTEEELKSSQQ